MFQTISYEIFIWFAWFTPIDAILMLLSLAMSAALHLPAISIEYAGEQLIAAAIGYIVSSMIGTVYLAIRPGYAVVAIILFIGFGKLFDIIRNNAPLKEGELERIRLFD